QSLIRRAASAYTAGPALEDARTVCDSLARHGIASTVGYWNIYSDHPASISQAYVGTLRTMSGHPTDCYLSIKAPALKFDIDVLKKVHEEARRLNAVVHFDAMAPDTVDRTFDFIARAQAIYSQLRCTLPGRWRRSVADASRALDMALRVRVVKGEWSGIGYDETDPREGFLNIIESLAGRAIHVGVATHNAAIARLALRRLK